jgi:hypothetical protein
LLSRYVFPELDLSALYLRLYKETDRPAATALAHEAGSAARDRSLLALSAVPACVVMLG